MEVFFHLLCRPCCFVFQSSRRTKFVVYILRWKRGYLRYHLVYLPNFTDEETEGPEVGQPSVKQAEESEFIPNIDLLLPIEHTCGIQKAILF